MKNQFDELKELAGRTPVEKWTKGASDDGSIGCNSTNLFSASDAPSWTVGIEKRHPQREKT